MGLEPLDPEEQERLKQAFDAHVRSKGRQALYFDGQGRLKDVGLLDEDADSIEAVSDIPYHY